ncbi:MAG: hypothetical protein V4612_06745 [Pseudomonadota bacterium]
MTDNIDDEDLVLDIFSGILDEVESDFENDDLKEFLLKLKAESTLKNSVDKDGNSLFHHLVCFKPSFYLALIELGFDQNLKNKYGASPENLYTILSFEDLAKEYLLVYSQPDSTRSSNILKKIENFQIKPELFLIEDVGGDNIGEFVKEFIETHQDKIPIAAIVQITKVLNAKSNQPEYFCPDNLKAKSSFVVEIYNKMAALRDAGRDLEDFKQWKDCFKFIPEMGVDEKGQFVDINDEQKEFNEKEMGLVIKIFDNHNEAFNYTKEPLAKRQKVGNGSPNSALKTQLGNCVLQLQEQQHQNSVG